MSDNRIEGAVKKATGAVKEAAGKLTGDEKLQAEGVVEKVVGAAQNEIGKVQDKLGDKLKS